MHIPVRIAGGLAGLAVAAAAVGAMPSAHADAPAACAQQQKQLDQAQVALDKVSAIFTRQQDRVKKAQQEVKGPITGSEHANAERGLARAKHQRDQAKQVKSAQQQRLTHAQQRLETCQAAQPAPAPEPPAGE